MHARSRGLGQIVESIAAQLGIPTEVSAVELVSLISVELHRHLLDGVRELGLDAAYRPMLLKDIW